MPITPSIQVSDAPSDLTWKYIPQAGRVPAFPVFLDSSFPPCPRSSVPEWTTTVRCNMSTSAFHWYNNAGSTYTNDALWANQLNQLIGLGTLAVALSISLEVSEIAYMANLVSWSTVGLSVWVDCSYIHQLSFHVISKRSEGSGGRLTMRASGGAAVGIISKLMDVEATLCVGIIASEVPADGCWCWFGSLLEGDGSGDLWVSADSCNCGEGTQS